jgi:hypothetical protein
MKNQIAKVFSLAQKINRQHIQIALALLVLALFVLAAGAPSDGGLLCHRIIR